MRGHLGFPRLAACLALAALALGGDWPQWRGPGRDGVAPPATGPASWPRELTRIWSVTVGEGHSSPVQSGDRVYVHAREADQEVVRAIDLSTGKVLWHESWPVDYKVHPAATAHGKGPKSTPALSDGRLFTFGISGALTALDAATGRVVWRREFGSRFKTTSPLYGTAASPMVLGDVLVAHVGGHHDGSLTAFDTRTGQERWSLAGDGPGYASPVAGDLGGRGHLVTLTDQRIVAVDPQNGALLWSLPLTTPYDQNVVTPLLRGGRLVVSGLEQGVRSYAVQKTGEAYAASLSWEQKDASFYLSSPVMAGTGCLFGFSYTKHGQFVCLDPATGRMMWASAGRDADQASLAIVEDAVLALTDSGELIVFRQEGAAFVPVARYKVAESPTWASPVPTSRGVLIKDLATLALWGWSAPSKQRP